MISNSPLSALRVSAVNYLKSRESGIQRRGAEYAEIYDFKLSPQRPPRLCGELSEILTIGEPELGAISEPCVI
jgi:hypothetical protein